MLSFNQNCGLSLASENWFMLLGSKISVFHLIPYTEFQPCVTFVFSHYCFSVSHMVLLIVLVANFAVGCFDWGTKSALEEQEWIWKQVYDLHKLIDPEPFGS